MSPVPQVFPDSQPKQWVATACYLALGFVVSSCSGITSTTQDSNYSTHTGTVRPIQAMKSPRLGGSPLLRYYLPIPYIQVYAYEVRLLGKETIRIGFRPVVAPDIEHPFLIDHNFGSLVEDNLQITTSPEGLLEYIGYRREPKAVEAAAAVARAALSFAAPLPGPFKGEDGLPEFSRLVFKQNYPVLNDGTVRTNFQTAGRSFHLEAALLNTTDRVKQASSKVETNLMNSKTQVAGIHHRPLMPLTVTITEQAGSKDARASRREVMLMALGGANPARENALASVISKQDFGGSEWELEFKEFSDNKPTVFSIRNLTDEERNRIQKQLNPDPTVPATNRTSVPQNLIGVTFKEAPISISDIIYVPNPNQIDTFFLPKPIFAPQSYELNFAGGSIYDVKVRRKSEVLSFVNGVTDFAGSFVRVPANLFTFTVVHEEKSGGGAFRSDSVGGSKDPGDYRKKQDKDPGDYRRKVDKD